MPVAVAAGIFLPGGEVYAGMTDKGSMELQSRSIAAALTVPASRLVINGSHEQMVQERAGKYLIFRLGREEFGTAVLKVREIIGMQDITAVPQTPVHVKGVINLRGKVIPVIDLRLKFGMGSEAYTQRTCIIVVRSRMQGEEVLIGVIVDSVSEVLNLPAGDIQDTPLFGSETPSQYLIGMAKVKGEVKILLDMDYVLSSHELVALQQLLA